MWIIGIWGFLTTAMILASQFYNNTATEMILEQNARLQVELLMYVNNSAYRYVHNEDIDYEGFLTLEDLKDYDYISEEFVTDIPLQTFVKDSKVYTFMPSSNGFMGSEMSLLRKNTLTSGVVTKKGSEFYITPSQSACTGYDSALSSCELKVDEVLNSHLKHGYMITRSG